MIKIRIWHKQLISKLDRKHILAQWRELSAIVGAIQKNGTPNHLLVNKVLDYPYSHLEAYARMIDNEMVRRGYKVSQSVRDKIYNFCNENNTENLTEIAFTDLYSGWHNERYLHQCLTNLEEKYDCGGITEKEWDLLLSIERN